MKITKTFKPKPWALYWCSTPCHCEDAFVVARGASAAAELVETSEDFETGEVEARFVRVLPDGLHVDGVGYADGRILKRCGARLGRHGTVRICGRTYRSGDLAKSLFRALARERKDEIRAARLMKKLAAI